jgi:DNA-binding transcriptional LysR family regulator
VNTSTDLKLLRTFITVIEYGSMTRAAEELGYVPSAVSQHVAQLERSLGVALLIRKPGSQVVVTPAGRMLIGAASPLFAEVQRYQDTARLIAATEISQLRISTFATGMCHLLPPVLRGLRQTHPALRVEVQEMESPDAMPLLRAGRLDLLLAYRYLPEDPPIAGDEWLITHIAHEPLLLITGAGPGSPQSFEECMDHDWVLGYPRHGDTRVMAAWCAELGIAPRIRHQTQDPHASLAMVAAGLAISFVPFVVVDMGLRTGMPIHVVETPAGRTRPSREILTVARSSFAPPAICDLNKALSKSIRDRLAAGGHKWAGAGSGHRR